MSPTSPRLKKLLERQGWIWLVTSLLLPVVFIAVAGRLVIELGHDSAEQSATTDLVGDFNRLGVSIRDFEVPLGDKPARVSWEVHYHLYRGTVDSVMRSPLAAEVTGYLNGIEASVGRMGQMLDVVLRGRATKGDSTTAERRYRAEINNGLEVIQEATDDLTGRVSDIARRVERRWHQLLWLTVVSSLLAIGFGAVLLLYRRTFM